MKDLATARRFYVDTLGLEESPDAQEGVLNLKSGKAPLVVYQSNYAGTNKATSATWVVPDAEPVVNALKAKGVKFEHYDLPGLTRKGDLHIHGTFKGAWLKDPDGNILHILSL